MYLRTGPRATADNGDGRGDGVYTLEGPALRLCSSRRRPYIPAGIPAVGNDVVIARIEGGERMRRSIPALLVVAAILSAPTVAIAQRGRLTATADICAMCHIHDHGVFDADGEDVSPVTMWRSTMMALSARDPYFLAKMSAEVAARPAIQSTVEAECLTCHAPMGMVEARARGRGYSVRDLSTDPIGLDGVSCIACHKIEDVNLGERAGMSGHYVVADGPEVYGPYGNPFAGPMWRHTEFLPTYSRHISRARLCATCHNLYTPVFDDSLNVVGEYPEQVVYSEWVVSEYAEAGQSCQYCHMEAIRTETRVSTMPPVLRPRSPVWSHTTVGGNLFMIDLIQANREALGIPRDADFEAVRARTRDLLGKKTLDVELSRSIDGDSLEVVVSLTNLAGHKFPTGYPERRAWIHLRVTDGSGAVLFESGGVDAHGRIPLRRDLPFEPHHNTIRSGDEVQIYETVPADRDGRPTHRLLDAAQTLKDNRIPPRGFDPGRDDLGRDVPVVGMAQQDPDFDSVAGSDRVSYRAAVSRTSEITVDVRVYYQAVPPDAVDDLRSFDTPEARAFIRMVDAIPTMRPEIVASRSTVIRRGPSP